MCCTFHKMSLHLFYQSKYKGIYKGSKDRNNVDISKHPEANNEKITTWQYRLHREDGS